MFKNKKVILPICIFLALLLQGTLVSAQETNLPIGEPLSTIPGELIDFSTTFMDGNILALRQIEGSYDLVEFSVTEDSIISTYPLDLNDTFGEVSLLIYTWESEEKLISIFDDANLFFYSVKEGKAERLGAYDIRIANQQANHILAGETFQLEQPCKDYVGHITRYGTGEIEYREECLDDGLQSILFQASTGSIDLTGIGLTLINEAPNIHIFGDFDTGVIAEDEARLTVGQGCIIQSRIFTFSFNPQDLPRLETSCYKNGLVYAISIGLDSESFHVTVQTTDLIDKETLPTEEGFQVLEIIAGDCLYICTTLVDNLGSTQLWAWHNQTTSWTQISIPDTEVLQAPDVLIIGSQLLGIYPVSAGENEFSFILH